MDLSKLDQHIEKLRTGNTLTENEVKALCEQVRPRESEGEGNRLDSASLVFQSPPPRPLRLGDGLANICLHQIDNLSSQESIGAMYT